jgi:MraZ protein
VGESGAPDIFRRSSILQEFEQMFLGQYEHNIDQKGRVTIPVRYRDLLPDGAYLTQGFEEDLIVLPIPLFESISKRVTQMSWTDPDARLLRRLIFSGADRVDVDKSGRILIPQFLRQYAHLDSSATVIGVGDYFEIWSPELWKMQSNLLQDATANNQRFAALDLSIQS